MKLFNTMSRRLEEFVPLEANRVRMYTCGPTVYACAHIGNFRAYMFEDILRRCLEFAGYEVTQVMNLTDVDDKTIKGSRAAGVPLNDFTRTFKDAFFADLKTLGIEAAEHYPAATAHVPEMIALIRRLFDTGHAYKSDDGSVYYNVRKFNGYGKLAHLDMSGMRAGARVAQDEYDKESVADFALWKAWDEADGDVVWDSPWGRGRPGWHIECSAMSMKYLGESFDIHTGGVDNMFPHHDNEIAQSEAATGKQYVRYWMHCGHLVVNGHKMSKSLGNFFTLGDVMEKGYTGREIRYILLSAHYRQALNFTFEGLDSIRTALARLDEFQERLAGTAATAKRDGAVPDWAAGAREQFVAAISDDLNTPEALASVFEMARLGNKAMDAGKVNAENAAATLGVLHDIDRVLGCLEKPGEKPDASLLALAADREKARKTRDWKESDRIRDQMAGLGWVVQDTPQGQKLKRMSGVTR